MTDPSGLLQLGHRFYWPEIGRFIQQDPIGDGMNWYAYVANQPTVGIDPEGLRFRGVTERIGFGSRRTWRTPGRGRIVRG